MTLKITGNLYVDNVLINSVAWAPFVFGLIFENTGLQTMGLTIFWITAVLGSLTMFVPVEAWDKVVRTNHRDNKLSPADLIPKAHNFSYIKFNIYTDILVAIVLAWFGHGILAALYLVHIFSYTKSFESMRQAEARYQEQEELDSAEEEANSPDGM